MGKDSSKEVHDVSPIIDMKQVLEMMWNGELWTDMRTQTDDTAEVEQS
jgi:hypothetical protein